MIDFRRLARAVLLVLSWATASRPAEVPTPEAHLGYRPGADFHLTEWAAVVDYFQKVDRASDRVVVRELGKSTEGRPYIVAIVSRPETIANLGRSQDLQRRRADPRRAGATPVAGDQAVVLITCSIHSSEPASTFMALELLHELATRDDPATREVLDQTIVLLVPSANPDGIDIVARWYERSKGHPWEGTGLPFLYHKYAGHDTNRDWFMLNLKETRLLTRLLYHDWFPTLLYDVHQMSGKGPRLFVPPFHDPINPNLDPRIHQSIFMIGAHMAGDLASAGKRGVATQAIYDNWWNGGNRTTPQRHNIVAVLTEAASVKFATPVFLDKAEMTGGFRGFADHQPGVNFVDPWPGGWWRLRDVVDYELVCSRSLLTLAARYKDQFQTNLEAMARDAIAKGKNEPPFGWVVPSDQADPGRAAEMVQVLHDTGIEVRRATKPFEADGGAYPAGSWVLPAAQPYRAHLKDMMERQVYPARFKPDGTAEPPYDVAGWTLPLQMGVKAIVLGSPLKAGTEPIDRVEAPRGGIDGPVEGRYLIKNECNDDFKVVNALLAAGVPVERRGPAFEVAADPKTKAVLDAVLPTVSTRLTAAPRPTGSEKPRAFRAPRIGLYQPWVPSMDEGWTRFVLEQFQFPYVTLHNAEVRAGNLYERFDTVLIPSIEPKTLRTGFGPHETEPAYVGGLGAEGAEALRAFVRAGGVLVCLAKSSDYAIEELGLPVRNVLATLKTSEFYSPGSIVRVVRAHSDSAPLLPDSGLLAGVPEEFAAAFDRSPAFEVTKPHAADIHLRYAPGNPLESGWLLGPEKLQGQAALVEVPLGRGRVVLFGFPPQNRGQTRGTFRLLFNALYEGGLNSRP